MRNHWLFLSGLAEESGGSGEMGRLASRGLPPGLFSSLAPRMQQLLSRAPASTPPGELFNLFFKQFFIKNKKYFNNQFFLSFFFLE